MSTPNSMTVDPRARRAATFAKIAALGLFGFFVAPFILQSIAGLFGLAVFIGITVLFWALLPFIGSAAANLRMKLIKAEARKNPVETLQVEYQRQSSELDNRKTAIGELNGEIRTFEGKLSNLVARYGKDYPACAQMMQQLLDLKRVLANREEKWQAAYVQLKRFAEEIERASMIWDAAQAAFHAQEASGLSDDEYFAKLKTATALDSVQASFNDALASLDTSLMQSDAEKTFNSGASAAKA